MGNDLPNKQRRSFRRPLVFLIFTLVISASSSTALSSEQEKPETWQGSLELGILHSEGNANTQYHYFHFHAINERNAWRSFLSLDASNTLASGEIVSERIQGFVKSDYKLLDSSYLFASGEYERDVMRGYFHRGTGTLGYGNQIIHSEIFETDYEIGVGARYTNYSIEYRKDYEPIINLRGAIHYHLTQTTTISQKLSLKAGDNTSIWDSETSVSQDIIQELVLKTAFLLTYTTVVPQNIEHTDSIIRTTLIYIF